MKLAEKALKITAMSTIKKVKKSGAIPFGDKYWHRANSVRRIFLKILGTWPDVPAFGVKILVARSSVW